ncbi:hypothetical protein [Mesorhizobium sp. M7A.F.Ca.MR.362.00.0.0]|uniref:hypothetical protein n=1 Tax=Mesorhizobium sp. M7A.F.Ca.MR.362.00.0.0 TaxID=2496779 RepID=UPI000FD48ECE|nr:hypothetical protein [Mesorhizobium sp. M7A.F.Ca.MR.362.00.0.0]RUU78235.1 hypothetical protein EOC06_20685 [Mesorhizobium sp. M7A.F.Ca.MR.362.00.0.0]RWN95425.1 MAG: hypothetical protein EOS05_11570 [Mesorhizobium sp.]
MARPKTTLKDRVARQSHEDGVHLIWDGAMRGDRPHLHDFGNPARVLLNLVEHPRISIRPLCLEPRCIEPTHWEVKHERDHKYQDLAKPVWRDPRDTTASQFSDRELEEINENAQLLRDQEITEEDLSIFPAHIRAEIVARATA